MHNILITTSGRRVSLVRSFQAELSKYFPDAKVFASDATPDLSAACHVAAKWFRMPPIFDPDYIPSLLTLARAEGIGLVIPTIDLGLDKFAESREEFLQSGINLLVSDVQFIKACNDKRLTNSFFGERGIPWPPYINRANPRFPLFAKPFDGSCSSGAVCITGREMLTETLVRDERMMFVEAIDRNVYDEYTVDLYYTQHGELTCVVPRKRIEVRSGEVSKGITIKNDIVSYTRKMLGTIPGARGCITLQIFRHKECPQYFGIEINPRFGGGYPLSYRAGANFPKWIIGEYFCNECPPKNDDWENQLLMLRYDEEIFVSHASAHG